MKKGLLEHVRYPEHVTLSDGRTVATLDLAKAIRDDEHEGEEGVIPPSWLRQSAYEGVRFRVLVKLVKDRGVVDLTPEVLRKLITLCSDDLHIFAGHALDDVGMNTGTQGGWALSTDDCALVIVLGAILVAESFDAARGVCKLCRLKSKPTDDCEHPAFYLLPRGPFSSVVASATPKLVS